MVNETTGDRIKNWGLWLALGIILILCGLFLLTSPVVATIASVFVFGSFLLGVGIIHIITAIIERRSEYTSLHLVLGALTIVVGALMLINPKASLMAITLLIAAFFLSIGLFRIIQSILLRFKGWGWYLLNGFISFILGVLILIHWPSSSLWVIGLFIGIDLLFAGWALIMIALFVKKSAVLPQ